MLNTSTTHGSSNRKVPAQSKKLVEVVGASFIADGKTLLQAIDLTVSQGEIITLIGPNGAGKTTLLRLILGILKPTSGRVIKSGQMRIGYVPQKFNIEKTIPMDVERFITLKHAASKTEIAHVLELTGASNLIRKQVADLSGGEFQRVLLARALLGRPGLLVLDEPARGLDYSGEAAFYRLIEKIRDELNCGILLVSHDLHVVMAASDQIVCLNQHICCSGIPAQIASNPEYKRLFGPEAADAMAVYQHEHDHHHDISGKISHSPHDHDETCDCDHDHDHGSKSQ